MKRKSDSSSGRSPGKKRCRKEPGGQPPSHNAELASPERQDQEQEAARQETPEGLQAWVDTYLVRFW